MFAPNMSRSACSLGFIQSFTPSRHAALDLRHSLHFISERQPQFTTRTFVTISLKKRPRSDRQVFFTPTCTSSTSVPSSSSSFSSSSSSSSSSASTAPLISNDEPKSSNDDGPEEDEQVIEKETFRVSEAQSDQRIDKLLASHFEKRSRTYIQSLLSQSLVQLDDKVVTSKSIRPVTDQLISIKFLPAPSDTPLIPEPIPLSVLYDDEYLCVIDKPAGLVVHPSPGHWTGTLVHALLYHFPSLSSTQNERPGIVHRLDKGTSGVIVIAKTDEAHMKLSEMFSKREVKKEYLAITIGNPCGGDGKESIHIDVPVNRCKKDRTKMVVDTENGKQAQTSIQTLGHDVKNLLYLSKVHLHTGRTHQIRVHTNHVRCPILGDDLYGIHDINKRFSTSVKRQMLHAWSIKFHHPIQTDQVIHVKAPVPDDMKHVLQRLFNINM